MSPNDIVEMSPAERARRLVGDMPWVTLHLTAERVDDLRKQIETCLEAAVCQEREVNHGKYGKPASTLAREIAARVWCDQEMSNCVMDVDAAEEIAAIVDRVRRNQAEQQSYDDLAASGGIVNAL